MTVSPSNGPMASVPLITYQCIARAFPGPLNVGPGVNVQWEMKPDRALDCQRLRHRMNMLAEKASDELQVSVTRSRGQLKPTEPFAAVCHEPSPPAPDVQLDTDATGQTLV